MDDRTQNANATMQRPQLPVLPVKMLNSDERSDALGDVLKGELDGTTHAGRIVRQSSAMWGSAMWGAIGVADQAAMNVFDGR